MLTAIYAIVSLLVLILFIVVYLILHRFVENLLERYAERRKHYFEPHVLSLLDDPTATGPLEHGLLSYDRKFIRELLLQ